MIKDSGERRYNGRRNKVGDRRGCQITHGMSGTRIYSIWRDMKRRCNNPKNKRFNRYGGRGIKVCEDWQEFMPFYEWAMQAGYEDTLTIERMDIDGDYCPENCKWIPSAEQQLNTSRSHFLTVNGERKTISEWSRITGIRSDVIKDRVNKLHWTDEEAVSVPTLPMGGKYKVCQK